MTEHSNPLRFSPTAAVRRRDQSRARRAGREVVEILADRGGSALAAVHPDLLVQLLDVEILADRGGSALGR